MGAREQRARRQAKRERRAARRAEREAEARVTGHSAPVVWEGAGPRPLFSVEEAEVVEGVMDTLQDQLDHLHADLAVILKHLGIERPECQGWEEEEEEPEE